MAAGLAPVKVSEQTDQLISQTAHFLDRSKKDIVDQAVREYVERHREDIHRGVAEALAQLDGTKASAVSLLTGLSAADIERLGGVDETR
jgi:predicted transcriptional regulator